VKRRAFIAALGGAAVTWPLSARTQQVRRIGVLMAFSESDPEAQKLTKTFVQGLDGLGWTQGRNLQIDFRWALGNIAQMQTLARELVDLKPDVILANTTPVTRALQQLTKTIPLVFVIVSDPIGEGFVQGLARPGGNITGFINVEAGMGGKWLSVLKEAAPAVARVAVLFNPETAPGRGAYFRPSIDEAARALGVIAVAAPVRSPADIDSAIESIAREPNGGVVAMTDGFIQVHRPQIIATTARLKLPLVGYNNTWARGGALVSYGHDNIDLFRRAAPYFDRILRGAKPAELPVQLPTKFEFIVNLKTAQSLGLTIPEIFLRNADEVIE
jgi:putative ABC transport system substrate-binding protein